MLSDQDVLELCAQASLALSEDERARVQDELTCVLDYLTGLHVLGSLDGVEPLWTVHGADLPLRDDVCAPRSTREEVLANAGKTKGQFFEVPPVLNGN